MDSTTAIPSKYTFFGGTDSEYASDDFHLDSEVEAKMIEARKSKKVAFMSGSHRPYFPEKPGHSKFAQVFNAFGDPELPPRKLYKPPDTIRLDKPVSGKGYGMGGLTGARFSRNPKDKDPGPGQYFKDLVGKCQGRQHGFPPQVWMNFGLLKPDDGPKLQEPGLNHRLTSMWEKCHQIRIAFGSNIKQPRFGKESKWNCVGPGHYVTRQFKPPRTMVNNGFLGGPAFLNTATQLHCSYGPKESCVECGRMLMSSMDYYRSKYNMYLVPFKNKAAANKKRSSPTELDVKKTDSVIPIKLPSTTTTGKDHEGKVKEKKKRVLLCRQCYCNALRGESKYWRKKKEVQRLFEKTRHCSYIHEHNGMPEFVAKASCRLTRKLERKEAILSKHWPETCARRMVVNKND